MRTLRPWSRLVLNMGTNKPATWFKSAMVRVKSFFTKVSSGDYSRRGRRYFEKGQHDKALADFTEAIRLDPNMAVAHYNRGRCGINLANFYPRPAQTGKHDKAITDVLVEEDYADLPRPRIDRRHDAHRHRHLRADRNRR